MHYLSIVNRTITFIENHLESGELLTLERLSQNENISKYYLNRLFASATGKTLKQYILARKLNRALALMKLDTLSFTDITYQLGFSNQAAFIRAFKKQFQVTPQVFKDNLLHEYAIEDVPVIPFRSLKNYNGDIMIDFDLGEFPIKQITGIVFEVNLEDPHYKELIHQQAKDLMTLVIQQGFSSEISKVMIYSNCQPNSSQFKAIFGVPLALDLSQTNIPNIMTIDVPSVFSAHFRYHGDLLDISPIFESDFARFIKLTQMDTQGHGIELIQLFDEVDDTLSRYTLWVPIVKTATDEESDHDFFADSIPKESKDSKK